MLDKTVIAIVVAAVVTSVLDMVFEARNLKKGTTVSSRRRLAVLFISSFVFLMLIDLVLMLFGEPITWYDVLINLGICVAIALIAILFRWVIKAIRKGSGNGGSNEGDTGPNASQTDSE